MATLKEQIEKSIKDEIKNSQKRLADARKSAQLWSESVGQLPLAELDELGVTASMGSFMYPLTFHMELNKQNMTTIDKLMKSYGFVKRNDDDIWSWVVIIKYELPTEKEFGHFISFHFEPTPESKKVCIINKIGEKEDIRKVAIYEIVCPEGVEELNGQS
jgi:hypothetical protein